jgi:hypothetical protein
MHWHPGLNHQHPHEHGKCNHHGTAFGKERQVIEVDGPDLSLLLQQSIEKVKAERAR